MAGGEMLGGALPGAEREVWMGRDRREAGFSLIEIIITVGILLTITLAVSTVLRNTIAIRTSLSQSSKVTHRIGVAMQRLARDVGHAFIVSTKDTERGALFRVTKTAFKIDSGGGGSHVLVMTTMAHQPTTSGRHEAELALVRYELRDDKEVSGRKNLYRGVASPVPDDIDEEPPMRLLARNIKTLRFDVWDGADWKDEGWDTTRSQWRNHLPRMVRIQLEAWTEDVPPGETSVPADNIYEDTVTTETVVFLPYAVQFAEKKEASKSVRWGNL